MLLETGPSSKAGSIPEADFSFCKSEESRNANIGLKSWRALKLCESVPTTLWHLCFAGANTLKYNNNEDYL